MSQSTRHLLAAAILSAPICAYAIQAYPGIISYTQPDGTVIECTVRGDERCHALFDMSGQMVTIDQGYIRKVENESLTSLDDFKEYYQRHAKPQRVFDDTEFPTTGDMRGIVLLVNFTDAQMDEQHTQALFHDMMNLEGFSYSGATGSVRDYFMSQSGGRFSPTYDVIGPIDLPHSYAYYGANNSNGEDCGGAKMIADACNLAHEQHGVDFSNYDYNEDGIVDFVYVIYAGYAESYGASANTIWPHSSSLSAQYINLELDGKKLERYACSSELKYISGNTLEGIGTFCHEFGHVLGLPDIYNVFYPSTVQLGAWDVMDQGSYNNDSHTPPAYSSYERYSLGWLDYIDLETPAYGVQLPELTENNVAYRIPTRQENEFFTLENRQRCGWDAYHPGTGLMILHITYERSAWNQNTVNAGTFPRYDLVEADGPQTTSQAADLFPGTTGKNMFTDYSDPAMKMWDGTPVGRGINHIAESAEGLITFDYMHDRLLTPTNFTVSEIGASGFTASWDAVEGATAYQLHVEELIPDSEKSLRLDEDFSLMAKGEYPKSDYENIASSIDKYTHTAGWEGEDLYQTGGEVRVGSYGISGHITTPEFTLDEGDQFTVALTLRSYTGKSVNYTVSVIDAVTGETYHEITLKANKTLTDVIMPIDNAHKASRLRISTQNERLFIDRLRVLRGHYADDADLWSIGNAAWTIDNIMTCTVEVEALQPERTYCCAVRAVCDEESMTSPYSETLTVVTTPASIIEINADITGDDNYYDMLGRKMTNPLPGLYIHRGKKVMVR